MVETTVAFAALGAAFGQFSWSNAVGWLISAIGLVVYVVLIWNFYRFVARRDIFQHTFNVTYPGFLGSMEKMLDFFLQLFKYGVVFPLISFLWFGGYSILLFVISKSQSIEQVVLISIAVISAARILSYYNHEAAQELSKMLPMVILGVALVDPSFFQFDEFYSRVLLLPELGETLLQFAIYLSALEMLLRVLLTVKEVLLGKTLPANPEAVPPKVPVPVPKRA